MIFLILGEKNIWIEYDSESGELIGCEEQAVLGVCPFSSSCEITLVVDGAMVSSHEVRIPAKSYRQFLQALPFALEEALSQDVEDVHLFPYQWEAEQKAIVFSVEKKRVSTWLDLAHQHAFIVRDIVPDYAFLEVSDEFENTLFIEEDGAVLVRAASGLASKFSQNFLDYWLSGLNEGERLMVNSIKQTEFLAMRYPQLHFVYKELGANLPEYIKTLAGKKTTLYHYNLLQGEFAINVKQEKKLNKKWPIIFVLTALTFYLLSSAWLLVSLQKKESAIEKEIQTLVSNIFPEALNLNHDVLREVAEKRIFDATSNAQTDDFIFILSKLAQAVNSIKVEVKSLNYRSNQLDFTCEMNSLTEADSLLNQLNTLGLGVVLESSSVSDGVVVARYRAERGK